LRGDGGGLDLTAQQRRYDDGWRESRGRHDVLLARQRQRWGLHQRLYRHAVVQDQVADRADAADRWWWHAHAAHRCRWRKLADVGRTADRLDAVALSELPAALVEPRRQHDFPARPDDRGRHLRRHETGL